MTLQLNLKNILFACAIACAVFFCFKYFRAKSDSNATSEQLEGFIKSKAKEYAIKKIELQKDSTMHQERIDSAKAVFVALENKRKADNKYYQNKIDALKKVNTYTRRQLYSDSLARTMR